MCRNNHILALLRACLASILMLSFTALAAPIKVSLMMGGNDTATAVDAAHLLKADPAMREVQIKVWSMLDFPSQAAPDRARADTTFLKQSQHIFISTSVGRRFIDLAGEDIKQATKTGGSAYIVGNVWDADFLALA